MPALAAPVVGAGSLAAAGQPRLVAGAFILRPWTAADAPAVRAAYDDPEIRRWHVRSMDVGEAITWTTSWADRWRAEDAASWAVVDAAGTLLGRSGVQAMDLAAGLAHVAYWVVPAARRRGVATRALAAVSDWAFQDVGLHRLQLDHSARNEGSCRVALASGYAWEGTLRSQGLHADGWHDMHVHARIADASGAGHG